MTKKAMPYALRKDQQRKLAARAERLVVNGYPYSHNPYVAHSEQHEDCAAVCVRPCLYCGSGAGHVGLCPLAASVYGIKDA